MTVFLFIFCVALVAAYIIICVSGGDKNEQGG